MKKQFKKCAAEMIALIICVVIAATTALVIMNRQTKNTEKVQNTVQSEAYLFSGKI